MKHVYEVYYRASQSQQWELVGAVYATSDKAAIRRIKAMFHLGGQWRAVAV